MFWYKHTLAVQNFFLKYFFVKCFGENKLGSLLLFWLLSNAKVAIQYCSAIKTTNMCSSLFCSTIFIFGRHNS